MAGAALAANQAFETVVALGAPARARLHQIARYLAGHWPTPYPVRLRIERIADVHENAGETYMSPSGKWLLIRLDPRMQFAFAVETLQHEWAHAVVWPASAQHEIRLEREGLHPKHHPQWQAVAGEIQAAFYDGDASRDSEDW